MGNAADRKWMEPHCSLKSLSFFDLVVSAALWFDLSVLRCVGQTSSLQVTVLLRECSVCLCVSKDWTVSFQLHLWQQRRAATCTDSVSVTQSPLWASASVWNKHVCPYCSWTTWAAEQQFLHLITFLNVNCLLLRQHFSWLLVLCLNEAEETLMKQTSHTVTLTDAGRSATGLMSTKRVCLSECPWTQQQAAVSVWSKRSHVDCEGLLISNKFHTSAGSLKNKGEVCGGLEGKRRTV